MKLNFKIAIRVISKNIQVSILNITGLSIGLTASILIGLWIADELSYDQFHVEKEKIFQVWDTQRYSDDVFTFVSTPGPLAQALKNSLPEVDKTARVSYNTGLISYNGKHFSESGIFTDNEFFQIFTFSLKQGREQDLLTEKSSIIISETLAEKLFGQEDPISKVILFENNEEFSVAAVFKDTPVNSSLRFDYALSFSIYERDNPWIQDMSNNGISTFIKLNRSSDAEEVNRKIVDFVKEYNPSVDLFIWPFTKFRLYSNFVDGKPAGGAIENVKNMAWIAIVIMAMAIINFTNLSTASAAQRAKEVGIKKVNGASRLMLMRQFMGESFLMICVSIGIALLLVQLLIPFFRMITNKSVRVDYLNPQILLSLLFVLMVTTILAGFYPSFILSSLKPTSVLKGSGIGVGGDGGKRLRKLLVITQFGMVMVLITLVETIYMQIKFIHGKDVGYNRENVLVYYPTKEVAHKKEVFFNEIKNVSGVIGVSSARSVPYNLGNNGPLQWEGKPEGQEVLVQYYGVGYDFIPTLGMRIMGGRNFSREFVSDSSSVIISQKLADIMGFEDPIGRRILNGKDVVGTIIGVVNDFNSWSLHSSLNPVMMYLSTDVSRVFIKFQPGKAKKVIEELEGLHKKYDGVFPFKFLFMDESFGRQYAVEEVNGKLAGAFTILSIVISCLGLVGLVSHAAEKRAKEIGIRKVLGAEVAQIMTMLFRDFGKLILVAMIGSIPLSYYSVTRYLNRFAYRFEIDVFLFIVPLVLILILAFLSVFFQSRKAALANPADTLRSE